eukprot:7945412-Pyramimonas_sp.AAC.1
MERGGRANPRWPLAPPALDAPRQRCQLLSASLLSSPLSRNDLVFDLPQRLQPQGRREVAIK